MQPNVVRYNREEFSLEMFKEVFTKLFYERAENKDIKIHFLTKAAEEEFNRVLLEELKKEIKKDLENSKTPITFVPNKA